jgi:hypothetical protein
VFDGFFAFVEEVRIWATGGVGKRRGMGIRGVDEGMFTSVKGVSIC